MSVHRRDPLPPTRVANESHDAITPLFNMRVGPVCTGGMGALMKYMNDPRVSVMRHMNAAVEGL
jgi:hypothetical protein